MAAKISKNVTTLHHGLAYNEHNNIISVYIPTGLYSDSSIVRQVVERSDSDFFSKKCD